MIESKCDICDIWLNLDEDLPLDCDDCDKDE